MDSFSKISWPINANNANTIIEYCESERGFFFLTDWV